MSAKNRYLSFLVTFFAVVPFLGFAQRTAHRVEGLVSGPDGAGLAGTTVQIKSLQKGAATDANGRFVIDNVPAGTYELSFSGIGYQPKALSVRVPGEFVKASLAEAHSALGEVSVLGKSQVQELREQPFAVNVLDVKPLQGRALDIGQVLNQTPGVRVRETGGVGSPYEFSINGLSGNQIKIFLDGVPLENFGSAYNLNSLPVNMIDRIEVYKGVVPVQLGGDALGGAVNIITKKGLGSFADASYSYGSFNTHKATLNGQFRDTTSGFTVRANSFFNYSDNDYKIRDMETVVGDRFVVQDVKRFHDAYRSYLGQAEAGFTKTRWADAALLGYTGSGIDQQIQSGYPYPAVGEATSRERNFLLSAAYSKEDFLVRNLSVSFYGTYNRNHTVNTDTSRNVYDWTGRILRRNYYGAELGYGGIFDYVLKEWQQRTLLTYRLPGKQSLNLNILNSQVAQTSNDLLNVVRLGEPSTVRKNVYGLSYQNALFDDRWINIFSGKFYHFNTGLVSVLNYDPVTGYETQQVNGSKKYWGYSYATRYNPLPGLLLKFSYEKAYRLPQPIEVFGDGLRTLANQALRPESSDNLNLGVQYNIIRNNHAYNIEVSGFNRWIKDFIFALPMGQNAQFRNLSNAYVRGIEAEFKYQYQDRLNFTVNGTYQDVLNDDRYQVLNPGKLNLIYRDRLPNKPWLFGSTEVAYTLKNVLGKGGKVTAFYGANYVHSFDLNWETIAINGPQNIIPMQFLQYSGLTYAAPANQYSLSLEVRNLADAPAYDVFQLQKPGRSANVKLRYFLSNSNR